MSDYDRIAAAIEYITANAEAQPGLDEIAARAGLSPFHFQRLFSRWAGVSPKRFLQAVTVERAKRLLRKTPLPQLEVSERVGFSSVSRLHDHFVNLEAVTPAEFKRGGSGLKVRYGLTQSPFGRLFIAATDRGVVQAAFVDAADADADASDAGVFDEDAFDEDALDENADGLSAWPRRLAASWPQAVLEHDPNAARELGERIFNRAAVPETPLSVVVRGTNFQIAVWRALLDIPPAGLTSYGDVAQAIGRPSAVRAVGAAVGANPCAFLIPCHRVIRGNGELGGYHWGLTRKRAIQAWEAVQTNGMLPAP